MYVCVYIYLFACMFIYMYVYKHVIVCVVYVMCMYYDNDNNDDMFNLTLCWVFLRSSFFGGLFKKPDNLNQMSIYYDSNLYIVFISIYELKI